MIFFWIFTCFLFLILIFQWMIIFRCSQLMKCFSEFFFFLVDKKGYDMSPFIRRYAKYLNDKALSYRTVAFDFCKVKRGKEEGSLRTMNADKLLKTLPVLQSQLDSLLEFDCQANDLSNGKTTNRHSDFHFEFSTDLTYFVTNFRCDKHVFHAIVPWLDTFVRMLQRWNHQFTGEIFRYEQKAMQRCIGLVQAVLGADGSCWRIPKSGWGKSYQCKWTNRKCFNLIQPIELIWSTTFSICFNLERWHW